jgi:SnoaL-like domain
MDLQRVADEIEITALLHRYVRAVDAKDWDLYRSVFTDDAYIDYSCAGAAAGPRDEVNVWFVNPPTTAG